MYWPALPSHSGDVDVRDLILSNITKWLINKKILVSVRGIVVVVSVL